MPNRLVAYSQVSARRMRRIMPPTFRGLKTGSKSDSAAIKQRNRLTDSINYLVYQSTEKRIYNAKSQRNVKFKINFITLTLPSKQIHSDITIKNKVFQPFLDSLRRRFKAQHYVWRAEKQKNGNIHFHIVTDQWVDWLELRDKWNYFTNKLGYVDRFWQKHNHLNPNSTDVKSAKKIRKVGAYLAKYMAKGMESSNGNDKQIVKGRLWGCSENISQFNGVVVDRDSVINNMLSALHRHKPELVVIGDYFTMFKVELTNNSRIKGMKRVKQLLDDEIRKRENGLFAENEISPPVFNLDNGMVKKDEVLPCWAMYRQAVITFPM